MPCSEGTVCAPAGLTHDLRIQHEDGGDDGGDNGGDNGGEDGGEDGGGDGGGYGGGDDTDLPSAHYEAHEEGGSALAGVNGGLALAALLVHGWAVACR